MPPTVAPTKTPAMVRSDGSRPAWRIACSTAASARRSGRDSRRAVAGGSAPTQADAGGISRTSAATWHRPPCAKRVSGPTPQRPSARPLTRAPTSPPRAVTAPTPVTATWRTPTDLQRAALLGDEVHQGLHRGEGPLADLLVGDGDAEPVLDQDDELERVDRVEPQAVTEDRGVVGNVGRQAVEPEARDQELLHFGEQGVTVHLPGRLEHREASVHVDRRPGQIGRRGGGKEDDDRRDLLRLGEAAERDLPLEVGALVLSKIADEPGGDEAGRHRVDRDAVARHLAGE